MFGTISRNCRTYRIPQLNIGKSAIRGKHDLPQLNRIDGKFNPIKSAANVKPTPRDGLFYTPAPSAKPASETPNLFIPQNDPRKNFVYNIKHTTVSEAELKFMPALSERAKKYHLNAEDVAEIQRLRAEDPAKYTRKYLAQKFGCSTFFISLCSRASDEQIAEMARRLEIVKSGWSKKKAEARAESAKRKVYWYRDM